MCLIVILYLLSFCMQDLMYVDLQLVTHIHQEKSGDQKGIQVQVSARVCVVADDCGAS